VVLTSAIVVANETNILWYQRARIAAIVQAILGRTRVGLCYSLIKYEGVLSN